MGKIDWSKKPVGDTIMGKVARDLAMRKAGLDPLTPEERAEADKKMREGARNFDKYHRDWDATE